jgi:insulysin
MPPSQGPSTPAGGAKTVELVTEQLEKPSLDDRAYRIVRLANELEVLLVHDAETDKASAAMDVNVGSFCDEDDMPGMAHAVEHVCGLDPIPLSPFCSSALANPKRL